MQLTCVELRLLGLDVQLHCQVNAFFCFYSCSSPWWAKIKTFSHAAFSSIALCRSPEGRLGMCDVYHLSRISGLSFDCPFLSPVFFFFQPCHFSSSCPFICLFFFFPPCFFSQKILIFHYKWVSLRVRLFCMALVELLENGRWYVQLAAIWHWYLPLCIYLMCLICVCVCVCVCVCSFCPFLSLKRFFFNLVISRLDGIVDDTSMSSQALLYLKEKYWCHTWLLNK